MRQRIRALVVAGLAGGPLAGAALPERPDAPKAASFEAVAFMAGSWQGTAGGLEMEELWLPAKGGVMLGLHRDVARGRMVSFEFLRIETDAEGLVYQASPRGRPATPFRLVEAGKNRVVFANPAHDFPKRILYWLDGDGLLHARIEGDGKNQAEEWAWRRAR
jgi:hypothetical protein